MPFCPAAVYVGMSDSELDLIMMGVVAEHEEELIMAYELGLPSEESIEYIADVYDITYGGK